MNSYVYKTIIKDAYLKRRVLAQNCNQRNIACRQSAI